MQLPVDALNKINGGYNEKAKGFLIFDTDESLRISSIITIGKISALPDTFNIKFYLIDNNNYSLWFKTPEERDETLKQVNKILFGKKKK